MTPNLTEHVLEALRRRAWTVAVAEGDTGGVLLEWLTARPGSSAAVRGGVVAYHDDLKRGLLEVPAEVIVAHGAVSAAACSAMAVGVRAVAGADVGLATTGIAGPGGGRPGKPVGVAFVAVATAAGTAWRAHQWTGDRAANRASTAAAALALAVEVLAQVEQ
jgi:PncC family amidohydrolase